MIAPVVGVLAGLVVLAIVGLSSARKYDGEIEGTFGRVVGSASLVVLLAVLGLVVAVVSLLSSCS